MSETIPLRSRTLPVDCFVFKHSTACPVSSRALIEVRGARGSLPIFQVNVIEQRDLSDWVAKKLNIKHESPQLILVKDGRARKVWNRWEIKRDKIKEDDGRHPPDGL
jgi:bacillithiol system protein YtxJ